MPALSDPLSKIIANTTLPPTEQAETMADGLTYPSAINPATFFTENLIQAGGLSAVIKLDKVKITKIDWGGVKGKNYWSLTNDGQIPLIDGKYKISEKLGGKKVADASDGFVLMPSEKINVTTPWSLSWSAIASIILAALAGRRVSFKNYGTVSALGLNKNINMTKRVPISK